jgi:NitT/TauT family transport system substrate-binding protein
MNALRRGLYLVLILLLAACGALGGAQPTTAPIIVVASPTPGGAPGQPTTTQSGSAPTESPAPTSVGAATAAPGATAAPQATVPAGEPTATPAAPQGTAGGTITFAFDAFPTYYPAILMETRQLLKQRGYDLQLVPLGLEGDAPSEDERWAKLRSGEWDVLATTLDGFARQSDASIGAITALIDESAGADKLVARPEIATINDLRGRTIAFSRGSVGEYFLYYALSLAGLGPQDVTLVSRDSVADAVAAYTAGEAEAVSAWEPDVQAAEDAGATPVIASDKLRAILDVLISSRPALDGKAEALQAFHDAWFEAVKITVDTPDQAGADIVAWGHPDWTFVEKPEDFRAGLETLAQATLGANQIAFGSPQLLASRITEARAVWARAGQQPPETDPATLIDSRFALGSAGKAQLFSSQAPVNGSFLLTARVELPQLSSEDVQNAQEVVKLPLEQIEFQPESTRLTEKAANDLATQVLPVLRASRLYLKIEGSAAWPGPEGRFTAEEIRSFALDRATSVQTFLAQQGIDPKRLIVGTLDPKFPNSVNEAELVQDRIVRFTLVTTGGR